MKQNSNSEPHPSRPPRRGRRLLKLAVRILLVLIGLVVLAALGVGLWVRSQLVASLPQIAGEVEVSGIRQGVTIERDALGIPTIRASNRLDVAFATGFVHAQDRFFLMDLMRRQAAGEIGELFGARAWRFDRTMRIHRFRALAEQLLDNADPEVQALVEAYAAGVNAGLAGLEANSFEYLVVRAAPQPWKPEDTFLVVLTMFILLQDERGEYESMLGLMHDALPAELFSFLTPWGTEWDAPLEGEPIAAPPFPATPGLAAGAAPPGAGAPAAAEAPAEAPADDGASNAWAVAGGLTADGGSLLALDMHMGLSIPNFWYRAAFSWPAAGATEPDHFAVGVTLPGTPVMVVGSNTHVSWGFSNSRIDTTDVVLIAGDPQDEDRYLTPDGPRRFERHQEILRSKGGEEERFEVVRTRWGPLLPDEDHGGRRRAVRWVAHEPDAVDLEFVKLETARTVDEALAVAQQSGIPAQNFLVVDSAGHIAWTIAGRIPRRVGFDGRLPSSWADGTHGWDGWLGGEEIPRIVDPESGRLWTANNRIVSGEMLARLGDGNYSLGARARQIRDALLALEQASSAEMLRLQLDDRALFLARWRELLLDEVLTPEAVAADPQRGEFREFVENWGGRAAVDSVGYRLVREYRETLARQVFDALTAPCREIDPEFDYYEEYGQSEGPLWELVTGRPPQALGPGYESWEEQLLAAVDAVLDQDAEQEEDVPLAERTWGAHNTAAIRHLFSPAIPVAGRWLDMPAEPLPGDHSMPRVQRPAYGASQRMVVSPGRESEAIFHMPGGQSGHPLSPHYRDAHRAWVRGDATPLQPGAARHTLTLLPGD